MIALLTGKLTHKNDETVIVDVGGVGYIAFISRSTHASLPEPGETVVLHIHTHVREDALHLYGFWKLEEKTLFQKLITTSGIGPKSALGLLSHLSPQDLVSAIRNADLDRLTTIPGIGRKTAERMIMELKDKLNAMSFPDITPKNASTPLHYSDMCSALENLGYSRSLAENILKKMPGLESVPLSDALKRILKELPRL